MHLTARSSLALYWVIAVKFDVLIVGGGPAGSTLAWALRNSDIDIAIMDKEDFPRHKICAGWVTPAVMQELNIDLDDYAHGRVLQPISGFRISQIGQEQVQSHYSGDPVSYGIRRIEFDNYLLQRSEARRQAQVIEPCSGIYSISKAAEQDSTRFA